MRKPAKHLLGMGFSFLLLLASIGTLAMNSGSITAAMAASEKMTAAATNERGNMTGNIDSQISAGQPKQQQVDVNDNSSSSVTKSKDHEQHDGSGNQDNSIMGPASSRDQQNQTVGNGQQQQQQKGNNINKGTIISQEHRRLENSSSATGQVISKERKVDDSNNKTLDASKHRLDQATESGNNNSSSVFSQPNTNPTPSQIATLDQNATMKSTNSSSSSETASVTWPTYNDQINHYKITYPYGDYWRSGGDPNGEPTFIDKWDSGNPPIVEFRVSVWDVSTRPAGINYDINTLDGLARFIHDYYDEGKSSGYTFKDPDFVDVGPIGSLQKRIEYHYTWNAFGCSENCPEYKVWHAFTIAHNVEINGQVISSVAYIVTYEVTPWQKILVESGTVPDLFKANIDLANYVLNSFSIQNNTPQPQPLSIIKTVPSNGQDNVCINQQIAVTFNKEINPSTLNSATFTVGDLNSGKDVTGGAISVSNDSKIGYWTIPTFLKPSAKYYVAVTNGVKDLAGNSLGFSYVWPFTTGTGLCVTGTDPILRTGPSS